jgi:ADP-ribose pyrophosphatase YjhB (NUDIX family)
VKRTFELIVFTGAAGSAATFAASSTASPSAAPPHDHGSASGARQGAKWQERLTSLKALAAAQNLKVHGQGALVSPSPDALMCDVEWPIDQIRHDSIILLAGSPSAQQLLDGVKTLKGRGHDIIVVVDALEGLEKLLPTLEKLNEQAVEMVVTGALKMLVTGDHLMVYRFPKADSTTTIAVFADIDKDDPLVLTMVRGAAPFKDMESFPGGFLNVQLESLPECAARELMEECFVNKNATGEDDRFTYKVAASDLELIDVRSDPDRDERGHVVDHGFAWFIPPDRQADVLAKLNAGDDAKEGSARFVRASVLKGLELAFDHKKLFLAALARLGK